jgi:hypothetical protein
MKWIRVTKKDRCKVCGRADWCDYCPEIGLALCMRIDSDRPSKNSMGGWLHRIGEPTNRPVIHRREIKVEPQIDFQSMWQRWFDSTDHYHLDGFAMSLGVDTDCLRSLGCAWTGREWAFPMKNSEGQIIGIRLRNEHSKWAVKGSKQGLFIPEIESKKILYVCEGPTDTAAALTMNLYALGRPSCMGCEEMIKQFVRIKRISRVVIVTDNDIPGLRGAAKLQRSLTVKSVAWSPPCKDLRAFVNAGGTRQMLHAMTKDLVWESP